SSSLALLADAGHMLTDAAGLGLALLAAVFAGRPATPERTFGYLRAEILAAVLNAVLLIAVAVYVLVEAVRRLVEPPEIAHGLMLLVALVGLAANTASLLLLRPGSTESLNLRGAYLEVLGDLLGSAAVVVAALVIRFTGFLRADAVASALIALLILPRTWRLLRDATDVLLEATPKGVDLAEVRDHMMAVPGVLDVHDLHAWTITSGVPVLSVHVVVEGASLADAGGGPVLDQLGACLADHFDVEHCTFQLEPAGHREHEPDHHD
ncbi:MAG TPA: cation diffusion facilitator family transporter, partial [Mycobacteriales bacterium]|nr:cation diffusion facilitator family transporter [Mycobacteriales bacterium]